MKHENEAAPAGSEGGYDWRREPDREIARVTNRHV